MTKESECWDTEVAAAGQADPAPVVALATLAFGRYAHALNRGTADDLADCFTTDANLTMRARTLQGKQAIADFYRAFVIDGLRQRCRAMRHRTSSISARVDNGVLEAVCYFDVDAHVTESQQAFWGLDVPADSIVHNAGRYDATVVSEGRQPRFRTLAIHSEWVSVRPRLAFPKPSERQETP